MPRLSSVCSWPGCQRIAASGHTRCTEHQALAKVFRREDRRPSDQQYDSKRPPRHALYHTARWQAARADVLRREPLCRTCAAQGRTTPANTVDHIIPLADRPDLALDSTNLQPLCHACHNAKTARERGRAGQKSS